jgi:MFS superfamily sulfate permease-like transporter
LPEDDASGPVLIFGLEGEMFFGSTAALERHFAHMEERLNEATRVVVLRMKRVRNPDAVGLTLLEHFLERMRGRGLRVLLCGVRTPLYESMERIGLTAHVHEGDIFLEQPVRLTSTMLAVRHAFDIIDAAFPSAAPEPEPILYFEI